MESPFRIPASLYPFFQEYDPAQFELERSAGTIIERVLQYGNRNEIRWLFSTYSQQQVADWVQQWGSYGLPEPHLTFWRLVLVLPEGDGERIFPPAGSGVG
jgi:hypothetical protein